jgi:hypothetical protein
MAGSGVCGDPTGDGQLTAVDALFILQYAVGSEVTLTCNG